MLGYALLGAGWLVLKCEGALRDWAWRRIPWLAGRRAGGAGDRCRRRLRRARARDRDLFSSRPWGLVFPVIGLLAMFGVFVGVRRRRDAWPFAMTVLFFVAAFLTARRDVLALHDPLPHHRRRTPRHRKRRCPSCSGAPACSSCRSIAIYTGVVYWLFRGKLHKGYG